MLWGVYITTMNAKVMKRVAPSQEVREKERDKTAGTDPVGLDASQHADNTQEGRTEECQQLQQQ
jgi:hypothetical protein